MFIETESNQVVATKVSHVSMALERKLPDDSMLRVSEFVVGDSSGCALLIARNGHF